MTTRVCSRFTPKATMQCHYPAVATVYELTRKWIITYHHFLVLYIHIDQTLVNSLHGLLTCEIGGLDCHVITT